MSELLVDDFGVDKDLALDRLDPVNFLLHRSLAYPRMNVQSNQHLVTVRADGGTVDDLGTDLVLRAMISPEDKGKIRRWLQDSESIDSALILGNTALAFTMANDFIYQGVSREDLILAAMTGVADAVKAPDYDPAKPFNPYLYATVKNELIDTVRKEGSLIVLSERTAEILRRAYTLSLNFFTANERTISRSVLRDGLIGSEGYKESEVDLALGVYDFRLQHLVSLDAAVYEDSETTVADTVEGTIINRRSIDNAAVRGRMRQLRAANGIDAASYTLLDETYGLSGVVLKDAEVSERDDIPKSTLSSRRRVVLRRLAKDAVLKSLS